MPALDRAVLSPTGCNLVAFSGGPDSLVLLHRLLHECPDAKLRVVHVDHACDPGSGRRAEQAGALAAALGLRAEVHRIQTPAASRAGPEASLRHARYAVLESLLEPGDHVLTAHHADDQAETVLLRLLRGAGPRGLGGMRALRPLGVGQLGRPLLDWTRARIEAQVKAMQRADPRLVPVDDPSNRDSSIDRGYLRQTVLPLISSRWPGWRERLVETARVQRWAAAHLQPALDALLAPCLRWRGSEACLDRDGWLRLDDDDALALLRRWLEQQDVQVPALEPQREFLRQCRSAGGERQPLLAWAGGELRAWRERLWLDPPMPETGLQASDWNPHTPFELAVGGQLVLSGQGRPPAGRWQVGRLPGGARLQLAPDRPRQRLGEWLRRHGLPPWRRALLPAVFVDHRLVAVAPDAIDAGFRAALRHAGLTLRWHQRPARLTLEDRRPTRSFP
ncbi:MAG: tRNA lysidine(34) synthetase TilS [Wenzhouxiangellaceae bacterium]|nr:tRNA lysidine(34) synthetase TilS [Wenzhouxiangellaceae bacterium]